MRSRTSFDSMTLLVGIIPHSELICDVIVAIRCSYCGGSWKRGDMWKICITSTGSGGAMTAKTAVMTCLPPVSSGLSPWNITSMAIHNTCCHSQREGFHQQHPLVAPCHSFLHLPTSQLSKLPSLSRRARRRTCRWWMSETTISRVSLARWCTG